MTEKTNGYVLKEIQLDQVYRFIVDYFDPDAKLNRYENRFGESNEIAIYFTFKGEERRLFAMIHKSKKFSKTEEKIRMVCLDLDHWGCSVEIMHSIITFFGGYIDENDCDDEGAYYIEPEVAAVNANIIKITRAELNRRMGGRVVIIDED